MTTIGSNKLKILAIGGALMVVGGFFLPWASRSGSLSLSGAEGRHAFAGSVVLVAGSLALVSILKLNRWVVIADAMAVIALGAALINVMQIRNANSDVTEPSIEPLNIGFGLWMVMAGASVILVASLFTQIRKRSTAPALN